MIQEFERLRLRKEWKYVDVVKFLNTNVQAYKKYVRGERKITSKSMLRKIEDQLNIHKERKDIESKIAYQNKTRSLLYLLDLHSRENWCALPEDNTRLNDLREHYGLPRKDK